MNHISTGSHHFICIRTFRCTAILPSLLSRIQRRFFLSKERINQHDFEHKWKHFFEHECKDTSELHRTLNVYFEMKIVHQATVLEAALYAACRHNSFSIAARIFWALQSMLKKKVKYVQYVEYLK